MSTRDAGYTKTGNGWLTSFANKLSFIPGGGFIAGPLVLLGSMFNAIGWVLRGKPLSALSVVGEGFVAGAVHTAAGNPLSPVYWGNLISGVTTGRSLATHARKLTEEGTSLVTKPLGFQPTVLRANFATVGSNPGATPATPGKFAQMESERRGRNAQTDHNNYMRGEGGVHVNELGSANYAR